MRWTDITVRRLVLDECHKACGKVGIRFYLSTHFVERINLRSANQDAVFASFMRAVRFMLNKHAEFSIPKEDGKHPVICVQIGDDYFFLKIDLMQLTCLTYFPKDSRPIVAMRADRKFQLKAKEVQNEEST